MANTYESLSLSFSYEKKCCCHKVGNEFVSTRNKTIKYDSVRKKKRRKKNDSLWPIFLFLFLCVYLVMIGFAKKMPVCD